MNTTSWAAMGVEPKFKAGDSVTYTNEAGLVCPGKTIVGIDRDEWAMRGKAPRYFYSPSDSPWFSVEEAGLSFPPTTL